MVRKSRMKEETEGIGRYELPIIYMSVCFSLRLSDGFLGVHYFNKNKQMELKDKCKQTYIIYYLGIHTFIA